MNCVKCSGDTRVLESRQRTGGNYCRRRECLSCGHRFTTVEMPEDGVIIKSKCVNHATITVSTEDTMLQQLKLLLDNGYDAAICKNTSVLTDNFNFTIAYKKHKESE